jgi:hypothetical protein
MAGYAAFAYRFRITTPAPPLHGTCLEDLARTVGAKKSALGPAPILRIRRERIEVQRGAGGGGLMDRFLRDPRTELKQFEIGATPFLAGVLTRDDEVGVYVDPRGRPTLAAHRGGELVLAVGDLRPALPLGARWEQLGEITEPGLHESQLLLGGPGLTGRVKPGQSIRVGDNEVKLHWCSPPMPGGRDFCLTMCKHGSASLEALEALVAAFKPLPPSSA